MIFSSRAFATKLVGAAGALVGGVMIDLIQFPAGAVAGTVPAETIWWLGFLEGPCVYALSLSGVLFYLRYEIDAKRHAEIRALLEQRALAS